MTHHVPRKYLKARSKRVNGIDLAKLLFGNGEQGFMLDFTDPSKMHTSVAGIGTQVAADGDRVGAAFDIHDWAGKTYNEVLAAAPELFPDGGMADAVTGWTFTNATASIVAGALRLLSTLAGAGARLGYKTLTFEQAVAYVVTAAVKGTGGTASGAITPILQALTSGGGGIQNSQSATGAGNRSLLFNAPGTSQRIAVRFDGSGADTTSYADYDDVSVKKLSGFHGLQADATRPTFKTAGGKTWVQFNGTDNRLETLDPLGPAGTVAVAFNGTATNRTVMAAGTSAGDKRFRINFGASGELLLVYGTSSGIQLQVGGPNNLNNNTVVVITWDAAGWTAYVNGVLFGSNAVANNFDNTGSGFMFGSVEPVSATGGFFAGRIVGKPLHINRKCTADEAAAIYSVLNSAF